MSDEINPGDGQPAPEPQTPEPAPTPPEPTPQDPPKTDDPSAPDGFIEQKRFTGAIQKIQTLTEEARTRDAELAAKDSEIEQLKQQQAIRDVETQAGLGERDKQLEAALKERQEIEAEAANLKGRLRKIDMAKELGHPELINILESIPTFEDDKLQKQAMLDILEFSEERAKKREETLLAGITPPVSPAPPGDSRPASDDAWIETINSEPSATERQKLQDEWWEWRQEQSK